MLPCHGQVRSTRMTDLPLRFGTSEEFAACRRLLQDVGFSEEALLCRYGVGALSALRSRSGAEPDERALGVLTRLFIDGHAATSSQVTSALPPRALDTLRVLGLVAPVRQEPEAWAATVMLYPRAGVILVSDRPTSVDGGPAAPLREIVFSAITENTDRFLDLIPDEPSERVLDLGTGTGVAALIAARSASRVWAVDVTERAAQFAEFNRRLNDVANVTVCQGDLYEPVRELQFDRILIHPPYVPALQQGLIYQDAGLDGQDITRQAVSGLTRHLRPGGRFYCLTLGVDVKDAPFEHTVRQWLQPHDAEFDVVFAPRNTFSVPFMVRSVAVKSTTSLHDAVRLEEEFRRLRIEEFVYGDIVVQRHARPRPAFTVRRQRTQRTGRAELDWLLRWEGELAARGTEWLLDTRPQAAPQVELLVTHRIAGGELTPAAFRLQTAYPFDMEAKAAGWMAVLLARCDGTATGHDHHAFLREQEAIPATVTPRDFARLLGQLASGAFIVIPGFEVPEIRGVEA